MPQKRRKISVSKVYHVIIRRINRKTRINIEVANSQKGQIPQKETSPMGKEEIKNGEG